MQAKLKPSELSYLLHTLGAKKAVGVNNAALFPDEDAAREALLAEGFAALEEDGWLVRQNGSFRTNTNLMLLTAVLAAPEYTLMLTRRLPDDKKQTITYYLAEGIIVEQFYTADGQYLLTKLDSLADVTERLCLALGIPQEPVGEATAVTLNTNKFESAAEQAKSGSLLEFTNLLSSAGLPKEKAKQLAFQISRFQPVGNIEIAAFSGEQIRGLTNIILLKGEKGIWAIMPGPQPEQITLQTLDASSLSSLLLPIFVSDQQ